MQPLAWSHVLCQQTSSSGTCFASVLPEVILSFLLGARNHLGWAGYWPDREWNQTQPLSPSTVLWQFGGRGKWALVSLRSLRDTAQGRGQRVVIPDPWLFCVPVAIGNTKVVKGSEWTRSLGVFGNILKGEAINNITWSIQGLTARSPCLEPKGWKLPAKNSTKKGT